MNNKITKYIIRNKEKEAKNSKIKWSNLDQI